MEWYNLLVPKTRAYIWEVGFKPIIGLLPEKSVNATLVQCLIERWQRLPTTPTTWLALASKGLSSVRMVCRASSWVLTCWGGSTPLRPSAILTWFQITCSFHRGPWRSVSVWLGLSFFTCWGPIYLPMVGKQCLWGGWPNFRTLERHGGPIRGRHVLPIFTPPSTLSIRALCGSLWGVGSSLRLVLLPFLAFSFVACSLAKCIILQTVSLHLTCGLRFFLQWWVVRYGLITPSTDLVLKEFPRVRAHLARSTSNEVILRVLIVHASSCIFF